MVAMVAALLCFATVFANTLLLSNPPKAAADVSGDGSAGGSSSSSTATSSGGGLDLSKALGLLKQPQMRTYMLFQVLVGIAVSIYYSQSNFAVTEV